MSDRNEIFYHIKKFRLKMLIAGIVCILLTAIVLTIAGSYFSRGNSSEFDSEYCTALNTQMSKSIDLFLDSMNSTGKILFSNEEYIAYDGQSGTAAEQADIESRIKSFLLSVSVVDNFADYGLVYENGKTLGRISDGCRDLFNDKIYERLSESLGNEKTGWFTGFYDEDKDSYDFKKLFYVRKINDKAVFVSSCYSTELESRFITGFKANTIRSILIDDKNRIIFDTDSDSVSENIDTDILDLFAGSTDTTVLSDFRIASVSSLDNGWQLITVMDMDAKRQLTMKFALISVFVVIIILMVYELLLHLASATYDPERARLSSAASIDPTTGLHSADYTENVILDKIETSLTGSTFALMIVNITNLGLIEEAYGEETANEAVVKVAHAVDDLFGAEHTVGIMKRDEFAVFADFTDINLLKAYDDIKASVSGLAKRLERCELDNDRGEIKTAVGAALYPDCSADYDELLSLAEDAAKQCSADRTKTYVLYKKKGDVKQNEENDKA
ncbi:MAG: diguanylate cyclase [Ruminococcus sp.]|nr:diguanylate cyclase [Ruminococcus sp.]